MMNMKEIKKNEIRVRFAPSPTGYLHIGSARTALFNWLYAKKNNGKFIIRIEDTDRARHIEEAVGPILDSLRWLGIDWDEGPDIGGSYGPYRQSGRVETYKKYAQELIDNKKAYMCFCSPEELQARKKTAEDQGLSFKYDRRCLSLTPEEIEEKIKDKQPFAVRLLIPDNEVIEFGDRVYGNISVSSDTIEDYVILRSSGLPTYNFSAAVDDMLMKITQVIRGEDHLSNTPKQILIYRALGAEPPVFTHLPMILGSDGQKLSKRHGAVSVESYRNEGFLPEAIINYIALLGWSYDDKSTIFSTGELVDRFSLENINKKKARFDYQKLLWMNATYIRKTSDRKLEEMLIGLIEKHIDKKKIQRNNLDIEKTVKMITPLIKERIKTINESLDWVMPFFTEVEYSKDMVGYFDKKLIDAPAVLSNIVSSITLLKDNFDSYRIENSLRKVSEEMDISFRKLAEVLRIALWANKVSPPLFHTMQILGYQTSINRINKYLKLIENR
jgi:glutamyl-tRNA synthetase